MPSDGDCKRESGPGIPVSRIANICPNERAILSRNTMLYSFIILRTRGEGSASLLFSGQLIIQAVLDRPMIQRSRSFGFAETAGKHFASRVACLRMACRKGEMDREPRYM